MKRLALTFLLLCAVAPVLAQRPEPAAPPARQYPAWEQLSQAERELLIAPLRERWNAQPQSRDRMMQHARRWELMTPEQRKRAHHGHDRWRHMKPAEREHARALFDKMQTMSPEQRRALRAQWKSMTPEQREQWIERNAPREATPPGAPPQQTPPPAPPKSRP